MNPVPSKNKGEVLPTAPLCLVYLNKVSMLAAGTDNATDRMREGGRRQVRTQFVLSWHVWTLHV